MRGTHGIVLLGLMSVGCAADAAPITADVHVVSASAGAPVDVGATCALEVVPDYRSGVNCHVSLVCGDVSLFGGQRIGGYAVCTTADHRFLTATDTETTVRDGDPAFVLDVEAGTIRWRDGRPEQQVELAIDGPVRVAALE
jgi:hypothetical protein